MHVLLAAYALSPERGSEAGMSWAVLTGLVGAGDTVTLLTSERFADESQSALDALPSVTVVRCKPRLPSVLDRGMLGVYGRYLVWQWQSLVAARALSLNEVDVVHHYSWGAIHFGSPLGRLGRPFVFGPVGGGSIGPPELRPLMRPIDRFKETARACFVRATRFNPLTRSTLRSASSAMLANSDTLTLAERFNGGTALVMPESLDPRWFSPNVASATRDRRKLAWVGRLLPRKGVLLALDVLQRLPPEYNLVVCGDGPERARAEAHAQALGISHRVEFRGTVPWLELRAIYDSAGALLFTSIRDSFGIQVLEACARGLPVIAIDQHGVHDFLPRAAGHLEPVAEPASVADGMASAAQLLLDDPAAFALASAAARKFAEAHTSEALIQAIRDSYRRAAAVHAARAR